MTDRGMEATGGAADATRRVIDAAHEVTEHASARVQREMSRVSDRAQHLAKDANRRVVQLTGRPVESWAADVRRYVGEHPLKALAITVGLGYVLGKLLSRD